MLVNHLFIAQKLDTLRDVLFYDVFNIKLKLLVLFC